MQKKTVQNLAFLLFALSIPLSVQASLRLEEGQRPRHARGLIKTDRATQVRLRTLPTKRKLALMPLKSIPANIDLSRYVNGIDNQGQLGSCTANALCKAVEIKRVMELVNAGTPLLSAIAMVSHLSRLELYHNEVFMEAAEGGWAPGDNGAMVGTGIFIFNTSGVCVETLWPYPNINLSYPQDVADLLRVPPPSVTQYDHYNETIDTISHVNLALNPNAIRSALAQGFLVVIGILVYAELESDAVAASGILPMPTFGEQSIGGHAIVLVGYTAATATSPGTFTAVNSWGDDWGQNGLFTIQAPDLQPPFLSEAWAIEVTN